MPLTKKIKRAFRFGQYFWPGQNLPPGDSPKTPSPIAPEPTPPLTHPSSTGPSHSTEPAPPECLSQPESCLVPLSTISADTSSAGKLPQTPFSLSYFSTYQPPPQAIVQRAIPALKERVNPRQKSGIGHKQPNLTPLASRDLSSVLEFFRTYVAKPDMTWEQASRNISSAKGHSESHARTLCTWGRAYLLDPLFTPRTSYSHTHDSIIQYNDFQKQLGLYLRGFGKYVTSMDVVGFTALAEVQEEWGLTRPISVTTANRWMHVLEYRWGRTPKGMYINGHERSDVVEYRQNTYICVWMELESHMQSFAAFDIRPHMDPIIWCVVAWFHDECTFYENNRWMLVWILTSASPEPSRKQEGRSLMVSGLISAEYGWLASPDGKDRALEFFGAGKGRDGYYSTSDVCQQISHVADILVKHYPGEDHVILVDNSPTHVKQGAVEATDKDGSKILVPMTRGYFHNGEPQSFYWLKGHDCARWFKGMAAIAKEHGWDNADQIKADCKKGNHTHTNCCLWHILYNEPNFANPTSILERLVQSQGIGFLLLPKFHPKLNPIEQCWGKAKETYRKYPESVGIKQLRENVERAIGSVTLEDIRKYCTRSRRICNGYAKGLTGRLSVYAARCYHGHRQYPTKILEEMEVDREQ